MIAVVEDDATLGRLLASYLSERGYEATVIRDLETVDQAVTRPGIDLVLLDINLPFHDGFYWCRMIRRHSSIPIVFLSVRAEEADQIRALEAGGDDCVAKPFSPDVLAAKIEAVLRRSRPEAVGAAPRLALGPLTLDLATDALAVAGEGEVRLTALETRLAAMLMRAGGRVVRRDDLLRELWDDERFAEDNTLTVHVTRLRAKLEELGWTVATARVSAID